VTFVTAGLKPGIYQGTIYITGNDVYGYSPATPVSIPVTLTVKSPANSALNLLLDE
jgi:hypothetical protein